MVPMDDIPVVLEVPEAAAALHLSASGLRKLITEGRVHASKVGRHWLVPESEVKRILLEGTPKPIVLAGGRVFPAGGGGVPADGVQVPGEGE